MSIIMICEYMFEYAELSNKLHLNGIKNLIITIKEVLCLNMHII